MRRVMVFLPPKTAPTPTPVTPTPTPVTPTPPPVTPTPPPVTPTPTPVTPTPTPVTPTPPPVTPTPPPVTPTPPPVTPTPTPAPPLTPAVEFVSRYENQENLYYIVPLKSGKSVIVCMDRTPDMQYIDGPFVSYEEAQKFIK